MLRGLLNPTAPLMSPFRVLYNLEVSNQENNLTNIDYSTDNMHRRFCLDD